jgi:hypothetical protein
VGLKSYRELLHRLEESYIMQHNNASGLTWLAEEMVKCYDRDLLCWYVVYGLTRAGKSTYAILSLVQAAGRLGITADWDYVSRRVVFDPKEILEYFKVVESTGYKDLAVIFDDAGVHLHSYKAFTERKFVERLSSLLQVAGVYTSNIIITTPNPHFVLRVVREMDNMAFIRVARAGDDEAVATIYRVRFYPPRMIGVKKLAREIYPLTMPYHNLYREKRISYTKQQLTMLGEYLESTEGSQPEEPGPEIIEE